MEIGVGVGTDLVQFAKNGALVHGIDLTLQSILTTSKNLKVNGLKSEWLEVGDAENLPFEENTFDFVYSFGVLHHTPNIAKAIQEVHRVLKPDSKCVIMLYSRGWKHYLKRVLLQGVIKGNLFKYGYDETINKTTEVHGNSPLTYVFNKKEIKNLFSNFSKVNIHRHRLGEFFDYAPYETNKLPGVITKLFYASGLEQLLGENYIITGYKYSERKQSYHASVWDVLWKPYTLS